MQFFMLVVTVGFALTLLNCGNTQGTSKCASPLTYVTNPFTSGENAVRHTSEYRIGLTVGPDDYVVSAIVDTASANLIINEKNFEFGTESTAGNKAFIYNEGNQSAMAINAKDQFDIGCIENFSTRFALLAKESTSNNVLGLAFTDAKHSAHEKKTPAFVSQIVKTEGIRDIFSMALCGSRGNSHLLIGGVDDNMKPYVGNYIPIIEASAYVVRAKTLRYADSKRLIANFPDYDEKSRKGVRTILDSSSSFLLLPVDMATKMAEDIQFHARGLEMLHTFPEGFFRTERATSTKIFRFNSLKQIRQFPTFEIAFAGSDSSTKYMELSPLYYFKEIDVDNPLIRTFAVREASSDIVLGQPFLENHYVVFDRRNRRIGFGNIDLACAP